MAADFLLKEGHSVTWILGNKLITVTTSGCSNKAMRGPLCDNCWAACKASSEQTRSSHSSLLRASSTDGNKEEKLSRQSSGGHVSSSANTAANSPTEENKRSLDESESYKTKDSSIDGDQPQQYQQTESYKLEQMMNTDKQEEIQPCVCWCQGWAEIYVRRPSGDMSWIMRIQNSMHLDTPYDLPLDNLTALYMPTTDMLPQKSQDLVSELSEDDIPDVSDKNIDPNDFGSGLKSSGTLSTSGPIDIPGSPARPSPSRPSPRDSLESLEEGEEGELMLFVILFHSYVKNTNSFLESKKSRNPVRRSNSSPEMSSNWKNPFLNKDKLSFQDDPSNESEPADLKKPMKNTYSKDMRYVFKVSVLVFGYC